MEDLSKHMCRAVLAQQVFYSLIPAAEKMLHFCCPFQFLALLIFSENEKKKKPAPERRRPYKYNISEGQHG